MRDMTDVMIALSHRAGRMRRTAQERYLDIGERNIGSTDAGDVMITPARGKKMRGIVPEGAAPDLDVLTGRQRPTFRMSPAWMEAQLGHSVPPDVLERIVSRYRGRDVGGGRHVQDFSPSVVIDPETGKETRVRRFRPLEGEMLTEPSVGMYEGGGYSHLKGGDIPPDVLSGLESGWMGERAQRESDLVDLAERWEKNIVNWPEVMMGGPQRGLLVNQFFNNARMAILGGSDTLEQAMMKTHGGNERDEAGRVPDITGNSILDIVNRRIGILDGQIDAFEEEQEVLAPLMGMQEEDFSNLLDQMRGMTPTGVEPGWADLMSILHRGEVLERDPMGGVGVPPSWPALRGAYEETRGKGGGGRPGTKFTGRDLLSREPFHSIEAKPGASMDIKDFFRNLDTSQGYATTGGEGLLRSQARQRLASIQNEKRGLEVIRDAVVEVLLVHEQMMGQGMTAEKMKSMPMAMQAVDDAMMRLLNAVAAVFNDPERLIAKGKAEEEGGTAARNRLNLSYNVDDASKMLILTKVLYLAKAWDAVRKDVGEVSFEQAMEGMPVEEDFEDVRQRVNEGPIPGGPDVEAAISHRLLRFATIADAKGFHRVADGLDMIVTG